MTGTGDEVNIHRSFESGHIIVIKNTAVQRVYNVHLILSQHLEHFISAGSDDLQPDSGIFFMKIFKTAVKFPTGQGLCNGDPHQTLRSGVAADVGGFSGETQDLLGQGQQLLPLIGQGYGMPNPFKQRDGQLLFQLFDLKGYGGLGVTQTSGRQRKALQFVHHNKGFQIFDIHRVDTLSIL